MKKTLRDRLIDRMRYYDNLGGCYGLRYNGKFYTHIDTYQLVEMVLRDINQTEEDNDNAHS